MSENELPVKRTPIGMQDFISAIIRNWQSAVDFTRSEAAKATDPAKAARLTAIAARMGEAPSKEAAAVLFAQYMIETGGTSIFNFNIGNVKHVTGDGHDFHSLRGVFEGVSPAEAERLISSGQAVADPSANHAAAVGPGRVSVIFNPPHPATRFRAFSDLDTGVSDHLKFLIKRFGNAWNAALDGDPTAFANALKAQGYFTASASSYAAGMRPNFNKAMASDVYDTAIAALKEAGANLEPLAIQARDTTRIVSNVAIGVPVAGGIFALIHKLVTGRWFP